MKLILNNIPNGNNPFASTPRIVFICVYFIFATEHWRNRAITEEKMTQTTTATTGFTAIPEETYRYQNDDLVFIEGLFYNQIMALSKQAAKVA